MTDRLYLIASVQDRIPLILFIRPFELLRAGDGHGIVAIGTATTTCGVDQVVVAVHFEPVLPFHPRTFVVAEQAERFAGQFQPVRSQFAGEEFDRAGCPARRLSNCI